MNDVQVALRKLRESGWTLAAIGGELGIPANTVRKWSAGIRYPANSSLVKHYLEELLTRKQVPKKKRYAQKGLTAPLSEPSDLRAQVEEGWRRLDQVMAERGDDIWKGYDPEKVKEALRKSAGAFKGIDCEALKRDIYAARGQDSRGRPAD